jgi:hypothetical protein
MDAFKLRIVKFSIRIRVRYSRFWVGAGIGFATGKSFRTTPVQTSVKKKRNKGRGCTHLTRLPLPRVGIGGGLLIEALSPSSVCSVIRISREKVSKARKKQKQKEDTHSISRPCRKQLVVPEQSFYGGLLQLRSPTLRIPHRPWDLSGPCAGEHPHASFGGMLENVSRTTANR